MGHNLRIPDWSGMQMVDLCPVVKWFGIQLPFEYWMNRSGIQMVKNKMEAANFDWPVLFYVK